MVIQNGSRIIWDEIYLASLWWLNQPYTINPERPSVRLNLS